MARLSFRYTFRLDGLLKLMASFQLDFRSASCEGECMIEFEDKAEIWVTLKMKVKCQDPGKENRIALVVRKDSLGLRLGPASDANAIQFQDYYSEARVISMMTVEFQATVLQRLEQDFRKELGSGSDLRGEKMVDQGFLGNYDSVPGLLRAKVDIQSEEFQEQVHARVRVESDTDVGRGQIELQVYIGLTDVEADGVISGYGVDRDTFRFASYSDVRAAPLIFIIVVGASVTSLLPLRVQMSFRFMVRHDSVEVDYVSSGDINPMRFQVRDLG
ncbi:Ninein-Like Protein [Manis pentadactyla]|nr:Ninein-Like Protein [Manis pentadactyla]